MRLRLSAFGLNSDEQRFFRPLLLLIREPRPYKAFPQCAPVRVLLVAPVQNRISAQANGVGCGSRWTRTTYLRGNRALSLNLA
jgi:hypothetical protein